MHHSNPASTDQASDKPEAYHHGELQPSTVEEEASSSRVDPKAIIAMIAINFIVFAQIISIIGSGMLAVQMIGLLGDPSKATWLSTCLTIFTLVLSPPLTQAADYWGRKWIMVVSSVGGFVGPLIISRSSNVNMLLAGFCILGFACVAQHQHRLGAVTAILMAGALVRNGNFENYRIHWYVVTGLYFFAVLGLIVGNNPPPRALQLSLTTREKLRRLDWFGFVLLPVGSILFCVALQWSRNPYDWDDAHILAPFIVSVVIIFVFAVYEWRFKSDGILHSELFRSKNFAIALFAVFIEGVAFFACNSYMSLEVQVLRQLSSFSAGLRFRPRDSLIVGFVLLAIFNSLMAAVKTSTSSGVFWGYPVLGGLGLGFLLTNLAVIIQMSTPREMISLTTGIFTACRGLRATVGLAMNTAIFNDAMSANLVPKISAAVIPLGFSPEQLPTLLQALSSGDPSTMMMVPGMTPEIAMVAAEAPKEVYVLSFRNVWIASAAFSGLGIIISFFVNNLQSEFTHETDAPMIGKPLEKKVNV
ncbi:unnamed protein product [Clonostachys rhizophaga]|uniref:Uncharacterized protein n=1 Tax=Clonostachys rhizophaga TaxID=160324 RepID=A0A9N9YFG4_9HYPO|nr:unnamed protein product [Clonostachys rhizophaga]